MRLARALPFALPMLPELAFHAAAELEGFQGGFGDWNGQSHENVDRVPDAISRCIDFHCFR